MKLQIPPVVFWRGLVVLGLAAAFAGLIARYLQVRIEAERNPAAKRVMLCLDADEVDRRLAFEDGNSDEFWKTAKLAGISGVGLPNIPLEAYAQFRISEILPDKNAIAPVIRRRLEQLHRVGFAVIAKPYPIPISPHEIMEPYRGAEMFLPAGDSVAGFPDRTREIIGCVNEPGWAARPVALPLMEFSEQKGLAALSRMWQADRIVRAHSIEPWEMQRLDKNRIFDRFARAVRERNVRLLYIHLHPGLSLEGNIGLIRDLERRIVGSGYAIVGNGGADFPATVSGEALWRVRQVPGWTASLALPPVLKDALGNFRVWLRRAEAFAVMVFAPLIALLLALYIIRQGGGILPAYLACCGVTLLFGLLIGALMTGDVFGLQIVQFPMVKVSLVLPLLLCVPALFEPRRLGRGLVSPVRMIDAIALGVAAVAVVMLLARSGNAADAPLFWREEQIRELLEEFFGVRPRFKEFGIGHPLLLVGLTLLSRRFEASWPRVLLLAGMVGQVSILNTFCHAHTPLILSAARSLWGIGLGLMLGLVATRLLRKVYSRA